MFFTVFGPIVHTIIANYVLYASNNPCSRDKGIRDEMNTVLFSSVTSKATLKSSPPFFLQSKSDPYTGYMPMTMFQRLAIEGSCTCVKEGDADEGLLRSPSALNSTHDTESCSFHGVNSQAFQRSLTCILTHH